MEFQAFFDELSKIAALGKHAVKLPAGFFKYVAAAGVGGLGYKELMDQYKNWKIGKTITEQQGQ